MLKIQKKPKQEINEEKIATQLFVRLRDEYASFKIKIDWELGTKELAIQINNAAKELTIIYLSLWGLTKKYGPAISKRIGSLAIRTPALPNLAGQANKYRKQTKTINIAFLHANHKIEDASTIHEASTRFQENYLSQEEYLFRLGGIQNSSVIVKHNIVTIHCYLNRDKSKFIC